MSNELEKFGAAVIAITAGDRQRDYGDYGRRARLQYRMFSLWCDAQECNGVKSDEAAHAAFMIIEKLTRIIGSPHKADNWLDIAGYAQLAHDALCGEDTVHAK